jgi:exonuclease SbcC
VRPIRLRIKNLRSYRDAVVEFDGLNIFAITGNTGVGKSSLLHAMTYGLFNRANSDARNIRELVAQGQTVMSVEFTFSVDGDEFIVSRLSRKNGSEHRLTCPARNVDANGEAAVNAEVVKALQMDADTFLHTVLLRQGMHAALLTSSPGPRNRILEDIFQLADIEAVQRRAEREEAGADGALRTNRQHRGTLGDDPARDIANASTAIVELEQRSMAAKAALQMVSELDARMTTLTAEMAKDNSDLLVLRQGSEIAAGLRATDDVERRLQPRFDQYRSVAVAAQSKRDAATAQGAKLKKSNATTTDLRPVKADLEQLDRELLAIAEELRRVGEYDSSAKTDSAKLETVRTRIQSETKASKGLEKALVLLKKRRSGLEERLESFKEAATSRAQTAKEAATLTATLGKLQAEAKALRSKSEAAASALKKANADNDDAEKVLTAERIGNQVAEISEHLHPGDDCPVCLRSLPKTFTPQQSADLKKADKGAQVTRTARETAQAEKNRIEALLESVEQQMRETTASLRNVQSELEKADRGVAKLVPDGQRPSTVAASWAKELARAEEQVASTAEMLSTKSGELAKLAATEATALANLENVERERAQCSARSEKHKASFASRCAGLPPALRPKADRESVTVSLAKVVDAILIAERNESEIREATEQLAEAHEALRTLEQELGETVREPRAQLIERLRDVARLAKCPEPPKKDDERTAWCDDVGKKTQTAIKRLEVAISNRQKNLNAIKNSRETCVAEIGGEPQTVIHEIALRKKDAERELGDAKRREKDVTVVEARIGRIEAVRMGLAGLKDALRANNFRANAAAQRQHSLLIEAAKVLRDMTKGRFEFAADFQILDRDSNETRSAGTLSGGEQFLASLALSLGVVEIAANAGSKIESLFLDEGFDALDARTLQQAMMELRRRAHAGRMICVISHVSQVTEFVNETLIVRRGENGSIYERRNGPTDDDDADVEGLVSHLTADSPAGSVEASAAT